MLGTSQRGAVHLRLRASCSRCPGLRWSRHVNDLRIGLYDPARESSACGVGFITRKDGRQDHDVIVRGEHALCAIPHRGGMSSEGVGDGAGVSVDLSVRFFSALTGWPLEPGTFGVANLFMPTDPAYEPQARRDRPRGPGTTGPGGPARTTGAGRPDRPAPGRRGLPAADRAVGLRRPGRPHPSRRRPGRQRRAAGDRAERLRASRARRALPALAERADAGAQGPAQRGRGRPLLHRPGRPAPRGPHPLLPHPVLDQHRAAPDDGAAVPDDGAQRRAEHRPQEPAGRRRRRSGPGCAGSSVRPVSPTAAAWTRRCRAVFSTTVSTSSRPSSR